ncbi:MAG: DUF4870 domain-containing protein [Carboxydocellales bacterium]
MSDELKTNSAEKEHSPQPADKSSLGLSPEIAGALAYLLGFISGIVIYILEKENDFVRFHAMQSTIFFSSVFILSLVLSFMPLIGWLVVGILLPLVTFIGWLVGIINAAKGKRYKFPLIGDYAEKYIN